MLKATTPSERTTTALQLLTEIADCADERVSLAELLGILLSTSRIVRTRADMRERAINRMLRRGILARQSRRLPAIFLINENYLSALDELRSVLSPGIAPLRERG